MKLINAKNGAQCFKGDQNIFWDATICNLALHEAMSKHYPEIPLHFFIHDEKLGAPDANWAYYASKENKAFILSDDYADSYGDACYINLDLSGGLFYLPVVSTEKLQELGIPLRSLAKQFLKNSKHLDANFIQRCATFGLTLTKDFAKSWPGEENSENYMDDYFSYHPDQMIFYLFTRARHRKGIVPVKDSNRLFSNIKLSEHGLGSLILKFYHRFFLKELVGQAFDIKQQDLIKARAHDFEHRLRADLSRESTLSDIQKSAFKYFVDQCTMDKSISLHCSSEIFLNPERFNIPHRYFSLAMQDIHQFSSTYNQALDLEKKPIQRIKAIEGLFPLPYYVLIDEQSGRFRHQLYYSDEHKKLWIKNEFRMEEYADSQTIPTVIGKAMPFLNELCTSPFFMALPEEGSKYSSACKSWVRLMRESELSIPPLSAVRIELNALDHLALAENCVLWIPDFLRQAFGDTITAVDFSKKWRNVVDDANYLLTMFKRFEVGQEALFLDLWLNEKLPQKESDLTDCYMEKECKELLRDLFVEYQYLQSKRRMDKKLWKQEDDKRYQVLQFEMRLSLNWFKKNLAQWMIGLPYLNHRPYFFAWFLFFGESFIMKWLQQVTFRLEKW
jgi:hypothetical protein